MALNLLIDYAVYNHWANDRIITMVEKVGEEKANEYIENSFPSIFKILLHILDAQYLWLYRLQHDHFPEAPSNNFTGNLSELMQQLSSTSENLKQFVSKMESKDLNKTLTYKDPERKIHNIPFSETILHCINHSTFHRGQIITMLRQLGEKQILETDYYLYCRFK